MINFEVEKKLKVYQEAVIFEQFQNGLEGIKSALQKKQYDTALTILRNLEPSYLQLSQSIKDSWRESSLELPKDFQTIANDFDYSLDELCSKLTDLERIDDAIYVASCIQSNLYNKDILLENLKSKQNSW